MNRSLLLLDAFAAQPGDPVTRALAGVLESACAGRLPRFAQWLGLPPDAFRRMLDHCFPGAAQAGWAPDVPPQAPDSLPCEFADLVEMLEDGCTPGAAGTLVPLVHWAAHALACGCFGSFVSCDDLTWEFGDWHSVQTVGLHAGLKRPGSPTYEKWHEAVLRFNNGQLPKHGAIWLTYFPNIMVEWYPNVLCISTLHPLGPRKTRNIVEFYYPEEIALFECEFVEAERAAYMETCVEDDEIAERMDAGRLALMKRGISETGPYQSPMEDGMQHFHEWYRGVMGDSR